MTKVDQMLARVAKAIMMVVTDGNPRFDRLEWIEAYAVKRHGAQARAAIEAMREPTGAMMRAGSEESDGDPAIIPAWKAMIDEALR